MRRSSFPAQPCSRSRRHALAAEGLRRFVASDTPGRRAPVAVAGPIGLDEVAGVVHILDLFAIERSVGEGAHPVPGGQVGQTAAR
jgi:hypothetical protein